MVLVLIGFVLTQITFPSSYINIWAWEVRPHEMLIRFLVYFNKEPFLKRTTVSQNTVICMCTTVHRAYLMYNKMLLWQKKYNELNTQYINNE